MNGHCQSSTRMPHSIPNLSPPRYAAMGEVPLVIPSFPFPGSPRSEAESCCIEDDSKFRQLPCRTFISCGFCPYRERCVFLHDPRLISKIAKTKTRKKNKEDVVQDSMFWPVLPSSAVNLRLDRSCKPHVMQHYCVPAPKDDEYRLHDQAIYSMWMHFVTLTAMESEETVHQREVNEDDMGLFMHPRTLDFRIRSEQDISRTLGDIFMETTLPVNTFIKTYRLNIFQNLAVGKPVGPYQGINRTVFSSRHRTQNNIHPYIPNNKVTGLQLASYGSTQAAHPHSPRASYPEKKSHNPFKKESFYHEEEILRDTRHTLSHKTSATLSPRNNRRASDLVDDIWGGDTSKPYEGSAFQETLRRSHSTPGPFPATHTQVGFSPLQGLSSDSLSWFDHSRTDSELRASQSFNVRKYISTTSHTPDLNSFEIDGNRSGDSSNTASISGEYTSLKYPYSEVTPYLEVNLKDPYQPEVALYGNYYNNKQKNSIDSTTGHLLQRSSPTSITQWNSPLLGLNLPETIYDTHIDGGSGSGSVSPLSLPLRNSRASFDFNSRDGLF